MTNPDPTAAPETCGNCRYSLLGAQGDPENGLCYRYPPDKDGIRSEVYATEFCGEWQPRSALADRAPTPSPVAVSETPVGDHEDHPELNMGPPPPGVKTYWPGEEADPYGPPILHSGGPCPWPDEVGLVEVYEAGWSRKSTRLGSWKSWSHPIGITAYRLRADHPVYAKAQQPEPRPTPEEHVADAFDPECPDCRSMEAKHPEPGDPVEEACRLCNDVSRSRGRAEVWTPDYFESHTGDLEVAFIAHLRATLAGKAGERPVDGKFDQDEPVKQPEPGDPLKALWSEVERVSGPSSEWFQAAIARYGLRLVRDLSEDERDKLADKNAAGPEGLVDPKKWYAFRAALDAVLGPVKP